MAKISLWTPANKSGEDFRPVAEEMNVERVPVSGEDIYIAHTGTFWRVEKVLFVTGLAIIIACPTDEMAGILAAVQRS